MGSNTYKEKKTDKRLEGDGSAFSVQVVREGCFELLFRDLNEMKEQARYKEQQVEKILNWEHSWLLPRTRRTSWRGVSMREQK